VLQQLLVRRIELHAGRQPRQVLDRRALLTTTHYIVCSSIKPSMIGKQHDMEECIHRRTVTIRVVACTPSTWTRTRVHVPAHIALGDRTRGTS
jgi:hypothetical protein